ncbi:MAG: penicillin-binding transpeptidase domain-containing protein, partial [Actinomycetota bacterium]|nr:penicillin-binding transpeptidase domain-containing protein [Actinomycetota bacterium]
GGPAARRAVPSRLVGTLRSLMRAVVAEGTGRAAGVGSRAVIGKTGTAEFAAGTSLRSHAWFAGARGSLAFAVLVEGGGFGGRVAAPMAARFLSALDSS